MKFGLVSLGCEKNLVDSELVLGYVKSYGHEIVNDPSFADAIIVNTCGFIQDSKKEAIETILEMASYKKKLIVIGCLATRYKKALLKAMPEIDILITLNDYNHFGSFLKQLDNNFSDDGLSFDKRIISTPSFTAYLRIADGCSNNCAYCAIPLIRGPIKSRTIEDIISEALRLRDNGVKEITLLAQDTTKYGIDIYGTVRIVDLLKELLKIEQFEYIRLLYLYPDEIDDELIELIGKEKRLTPYFDIPIQHSEDEILLSMNRRGNRQYLLNLFNKIKEKVPNAILRTTIMVGFPGETDEHFNGLVNFIKQVEFDHLGCFTYSKEEDTKAYSYKKQIDEDIKKSRKDIIMKEQSHISYRKNKKHIGEVMEGLIISKKKGSYYLRSYFNAIDDIDGSIIVNTDKQLQIGQKIKVKITNAFVYDLLAEVVE